MKFHVTCPSLFLPRKMSIRFVTIFFFHPTKTIQIKSRTHVAYHHTALYVIYSATNIFDHKTRTRASRQTRGGGRKHALRFVTG